MLISNFFINQVFNSPILACVLSEYRLHIFADNKIPIKPVIMFKANQANRTAKTDDTKVTISSEFRTLFLNLMSNISGSYLSDLYKKSNNGILFKAFTYFFNKDKTFENLALQMQDAFHPEKCILVDSSTTVDKKENQLKLNSLEDPTNPIRAVFAVDALNEGWDVLNLFDIVRLYNTRDSKSNKPGNVTVREAQLIGRGARYCPFRNIANAQDDSEIYKRKFDNDLTHPMRVCEELYYHSEQNSRYIQELNKALEDIGIPTSDNKTTRELKLKDSFKNHDFYKHYAIYINKREPSQSYQNSRIGRHIKDKVYQFKLNNSQITQSGILDYFNNSNEVLKQEMISKIIKIKEFDAVIIKKAIAKNMNYRFKFLTIFFPKLSSINEFITSDDYLGDMSITINSYKNFEKINNLSRVVQLEILCSFLEQIQKEFIKAEDSFIGSKEFTPYAIKEIFKETKQMSFTLNEGEAETGRSMANPTNHELFLDLNEFDWHAYNENYGTYEEKSLIMFIKDEAIPYLKNKYKQVWLLRNEKFFQLYNFADGRAFEPDFVLFLISQNGAKELIYQVFIEPKGQHLIGQDKWKEDFLNSIKNNYKTTHIFGNKDYALIGLPFYNSVSKAKFKNIMLKELHSE
jgi:type III restriction enzyme